MSGKPTAHEPSCSPRGFVSRGGALILLFCALHLPTFAVGDPIHRRQLAAAALTQVGVTRHYDPAYVRLRYPGGDVPLERGVCTDVVVRTFRTIGVDLQVAVHEDMMRNFRAYPQSWGMRGPDRNIDHRRVPNLMRFFTRRGKAVPIDAPYEPGDVVAWRLPGGLLHIGVVSTTRASRRGDYLVVHNIGAGAKNEDVLRAYTIIGHYRW